MDIIEAFAAKNKCIRDDSTGGTKYDQTSANDA